MRVFSYIVDHDLGFAPNPFFGSCSLAACKPKIRCTADVGDYLMGTGARDWSGLLVYWAKVSEVISYDDYWRRPDFQSKRPVMNGSLMQCYGDNIYHTEEGEIKQEDSFHSEQNGILNQNNFDRDVGTTDRVLLASQFCYLGRKAVRIPTGLSQVVHTTQGHKCNFDEKLRDECIEWLLDIEARGWVGNPIDWPA